MQELGLEKTMQVSFDFTEQTEIVKREKRKPLEARQDWQRAPKIIVTEEYIALDKKLEPIEEELFDLILLKHPLVYAIQGVHHCKGVNRNYMPHALVFLILS